MNERAEKLAALQATMAQLRFDAGMLYLRGGSKTDRLIAEHRWKALGIAIVLLEELLPKADAPMFDIDRIDELCAEKFERAEQDHNQMTADFQRAMAVACGNRDWM